MNQNPGPGQQWGHPGQGGFPPGGFPPGGFPPGGFPPGGPAQKKSGTGLSCLVIGLIATPILALVGMGALGALFYFIGAPSSPGPAMTAPAAAPGRGELTVNDSDVAQSMGLGQGTDCKVNVNTDLAGDKVKGYGLLSATSKTLYAEWTPDTGARRAGSLRMRIVEGKVSGSG